MKLRKFLAKLFNPKPNHLPALVVCCDYDYQYLYTYKIGQTRSQIIRTKNTIRQCKFRFCSFKCFYC